MRFSPTKLLHGLRCTAPIILLTLAACGGGGGGGTTGGGGASTYSLSGIVTGLTTGGTVVLQNNGGDDKTVSYPTTSYAFATRLANGASYSVTVKSQPTGQICTVPFATGTMSTTGATANVTCTNAFTLGGTLGGVARSSSMILRNDVVTSTLSEYSEDLTVLSSAVGTYSFNTKVTQGATYTVSVLSQPSLGSSHQLCTVASSTGTMPTGPVPNVDVACVSAYTISGTSGGLSGVTGLVGNLVLQNNLGDNLAVAANNVNTDFIFSTPLLSGDPYAVTVLRGPYAQDCTPTSNTGTANPDVTTVKITCVGNPLTIPLVDSYAYSADLVSDTITGFTISSGDGSLGSQFTAVSGLNNPSSVAVNTVGATSYAYVTNYSGGGTGYISLFTVNSNGTLSHNVPDVTTGAGPYKISIHPTGKYAYVVNNADNSVSGYSIDALTGELTSMDTDGAKAAIQYSIATGSYPIDIAIHPGGGYAYVVNNGSNTVSVYSIDAHTGALTHMTDVATGSAPASITIDPTGSYAYVANSGAASVSAYSITGTGALNPINCVTGSPPYCSGTNFSAGGTPKAVTIDPSGQFAYVANSSDGTISAYGISTFGQLVRIDCGSGPTCNGKDYLTGLGGSVAGTLPSSIRIDNSGQYLYVANYNNAIKNITPFTINVFNGTLTPGSSVSAGSNPNSIATAP